jgi:hypothetical protein
MWQLENPCFLFPKCIQGAKTTKVQNPPNFFANKNILPEVPNLAGPKLKVPSDPALRISVRRPGNVAGGQLFGGATPRTGEDVFYEIKTPEDCPLTVQKPLDSGSIYKDNTSYRTALLCY